MDKAIKECIVYVDMDNVLCDYSKQFNIAVKKEPEIAYPQSQYGFFRDLEPIEGAIDGLNSLLEMGFDIYILTAPSIMNPLSYTEKREWVEKYFGLELVKKLIISPNKGLNKGSFLIDDNKSGSGQENFEGLLIHFGSDQFPNWEKVIHYFTKYKSNYSN